MKLKGIVLAVIISLASIMMPFNVYADTISGSNIVGVNVQLLGSSLLEHRTETVQTNTYNYYLNQYTYKAVIELDNSYVGVIGARVQGSYYDKAPSQGSTVRTESLNQYRKIYVNGNTAEMTFVITSWISSYDDPLIYRADGTSPSVTIEDSNVTKYEDLDSIDQIIDLLSDIYQNSSDIEGLSTNQLTELQNIVSNTSLANQYLEIISELKEYKFPFESFTFISYQLASNKSIVDYYSDNVSYIYPRFKITNSSSNKKIADVSFLRHESITMIIMVSASSVISSTSFTINGGTLESTEILNYYRDPIYGYTYLYKFVFTGTSNLRIDYSESFDMVYIPIYCGYAEKLSTEFALTFGMSNELLDNIKLIAQGSNQSNSAASNLESGNDQMANDMDDLATIENGYNQQFNNQLQQIDFTSPLQSNSGILPAANFVITIFNGLINNNPFSVLIIIVCILLIGKKVIGK